MLPETIATSAPHSNIKSHIEMFNFNSLTTSPFHADENRSVHVIRHYTLLLPTVTKLGALVQLALAALTLTPPSDI